MSDKFYIFITVDTEASMYRGRPLPISKMIYGDVNSEYYGISKIMDILDDYSLKATFFVSVLEYLYFGEKEIEKVCKTIDERGHDVQLHIHPQWKVKKKFLWECDLETQIRLIKEGKELLYKWLGKYPIAHRAGGLSADENTLFALKLNHIPIDSSMAFGYPYCKLNEVLPTKNSLCTWDSIIEIPVTTFTQLKLGKFRSYRNLDINADTFDELIRILKLAKKKGLSTLTLLMHSFSFLHRNKDRSEFKPNYQIIRKFERFLDFITKNSNEMQVTTFKDFYSTCSSNSILFNDISYIPYTGISLTFKRTLKNFRRGWKNKIFVLLTIIISVGLVILFILLLKAFIRR